MKFAVVVFPGSNCDQDIIRVLRDVMGHEVDAVFHKETQLPALAPDDCVVLPGGFAFGDYLRAGAIARFSPIMEAVIQHAQRGGLVWGICNGFQVLCECGLLPGALLRNDHQLFNCKNVYLKPGSLNSPLTRGLEADDVLNIPIAHAEGRFYAPADVIDQLIANDQVLYYYCDAEGRITPESNPNGSLRNIAGICNAQRNVFGLMPHPERAAEEVLGNVDGRRMMESLVGNHKSQIPSTKLQEASKQDPRALVVGSSLRART
jgi:phosphoribosylformylglycinamidine synthase